MVNRLISLSRFGPSLKLPGSDTTLIHGMRIFRVIGRPLSLTSPFGNLSSYSFLSEYVTSGDELHHMQNSVFVELPVGHDGSPFHGIQQYS